LRFEIRANSPFFAVSGVFKTLAQPLEIPSHSQKSVAGRKKEGSTQRNGGN
jgi:hypothetical protein